MTQRNYLTKWERNGERIRLEFLDGSILYVKKQDFDRAFGCIISLTKEQVQAEHQLKERCREAAILWDKPSYTLKKHTLQFTYAVHRDLTVSNPTKNIFHGLAHFETGKIGIIPNEFSKLFHYRLPDDTIEFEDTKKVKKIRAFMNGRLDIRFAEEAYAVQFAKEYLGMIGGSV